MLWGALAAFGVSSWVVGRVSEPHVMHLQYLGPPRPQLAEAPAAVSPAPSALAAGAPAVLEDADAEGAAEAAGARTALHLGHLAFPLVTMTVYGARPRFRTMHQGARRPCEAASAIPCLEKLGEARQHRIGEGTTCYRISP